MNATNAFTSNDILISGYSCNWYADRMMNELPQRLAKGLVPVLHMKSVFFRIEFNPNSLNPPTDIYSLHFMR